MGDTSRAVAYCRPVGTACTKTVVDRRAKHGRAGLHATPWDPTGSGRF